MEILALFLIPLHLLLGLTHFFLQHVQQRTLLYGGHVERSRWRRAGRGRDGGKRRARGHRNTHTHQIGRLTRTRRGAFEIMHPRWRKPVDATQGRMTRGREERARIALDAGNRGIGK